MFIDYVLMIFGGLVALAYAVANILVVINYPITFMWEEFWVKQKWFGKICANIFYLPAWVISFALVAVIFILNMYIPIIGFDRRMSYVYTIKKIYKQSPVSCAGVQPTRHLWTRLCAGGGRH